MSPTDAVITVTQLRKQFHSVLRDVERGMTFAITRDGRLVARLVAEPTLPLIASDRDDLASQADELLEGFGTR